MEEYSWEDSPSQRNVVDLLSRMKVAGGEEGEDVREQLLRRREVQEYRDSVTRLKNEGDNEDTVAQYKEAVRKVLSLWSPWRWRPKRRPLIQHFLILYFHRSCIYVLKNWTSLIIKDAFSSSGPAAFCCVSFQRVSQFWLIAAVYTENSPHWPKVLLSLLTTAAVLDNDSKII